MTKAAPFTGDDNQGDTIPDGSQSPARWLEGRRRGGRAAPGAAHSMDDALSTTQLPCAITIST